MKTKSPRTNQMFLFAISTLLAMCAAHADQTWDGGGTDSNWNTDANWGLNTLPNFANQIIFAGTTRTTAVNNLTEDTIIGGISFTNQTTPQTFTLSGNRITLGGNIVGAQFAGGGQQNAANTDTIQLAMVLNGNRSFTTGQRRTFNFSGVISETGGARNLSTSGSIQLSAANTFSGTTTITSGLLHLSNALALQNSALNTTSSAAGLRVTSGVTTLTFGGLIGNKNFQSASGGIFNQTAMNSGGAHIGGSSAANNYSTITSITLNPATDFSYSYSGVIANGAANMTLTKIGAGTQILSGANTYTGATRINAGTLSFTGATQATNAINVGADGTLGLALTSSVTAASANVTLTGRVNVTGTPTLASYTLLNAASITGTPVLVSPIAGYQLVIDGGKVLKLNSTTAVAPYATWASTNATSGNPNDDFDLDGVTNAIEFVLGGTATTSDLAKLPTISTSEGNLIFTFIRSQASVDPSVSTLIEVGTTLTSWPDVYVVGSASAGGVTVTDNGNGTDTVTLSVPQLPDTKKFARLKVAITE